MVTPPPSDPKGLASRMRRPRRPGPGPDLPPEVFGRTLGPEGAPRDRLVPGPVRAEDEGSPRAS